MFFIIGCIAAGSYDGDLACTGMPTQNCYNCNYKNSKIPDGCHLYVVIVIFSTLFLAKAVVSVHFLDGPVGFSLVGY